MCSQNIIALKASRIAGGMSLLYFIAATILTAFFQPPPFSYLLVWAVILGGFLVTRRLAPVYIRFDQNTTYLKQWGCWYKAELRYQNDYWMTLVVKPSVSASWWWRLMHRCFFSHVFLYRDQFAPTDYRKVRSLLSVAKLITSPQTK